MYDGGGSNQRTKKHHRIQHKTRLYNDDIDDGNNNNNNNKKHNLLGTKVYLHINHNDTSVLGGHVAIVRPFVRFTVNVQHNDERIKLAPLSYNWIPTVS